MRKIVTLSLLFIACNTQSKADLQKEYDTVVKQLHQQNELLDIARGQIKLTSDQKVRFEAAGIDAKNKDTQILFYTKFIDSVSVKKEALEKRRQELASELFK